MTRPDQNVDPQRLVDLESKLGFLEHTVDGLNEVVFDQAKTIERLREQLARLEGRLSQAGDPSQAPFEPGGSGNASLDALLAEKPPHY